jgi:hypothetical protein
VGLIVIVSVVSASESRPPARAEEVQVGLEGGISLCYLRTQGSALDMPRLAGVT